MNGPSCVTRLERDGRDITIIGTAHVSQASVDEVRRVIADTVPDVVCVELDQKRHDSLMDENRYANLNIAKKLKERQVLVLLTSLVLAAYQKKIGERLGVKPGAELLTAVQGCKQIGARLVLADRDIQTTLKRTWANISVLNRLRLVGSLIAAPSAATELSEDQIEQLKNRDTISEMLTELSRMVPGLREPLIDERDQYLASSITMAPGKKIVAVVGAGHVEGILAHLGKSIDRTALERLPSQSAFRRCRPWLIPLVVLLSFVWGLHAQSLAVLVQMLVAWSLPTAIGCAFFTAAAGAHPLTVVVGFLAAPLLTLYPRIGAGMATAFVQLSVRRPTRAHCEGILDSITQVRGWYRNGAMHVLLVYSLSSLGATIGALIGAAWVISLL
jgi:pheromone shutdown-related protein TraB